MHPTFGATDCSSCKASDYKVRRHPDFATLTMQDRVSRQRDKHIGDTAQPFNPDGTPNELFVKSNSREDVEQYFSKEELAANGF